MTCESSEKIVPVRTTGKAELCHQLAKSMKWNLARFLVSLILPVFPCLGVTVTDRMVTKTVDTSGGCSVPTPATAFLTTDQRVWVWFNVTGANAGDIASATWYYPNGTAYKSANWNSLASSGNWCFPSSIDIAGNPPASSPGNWSVRVSWNGSALFTLNFTIAASAPSISAGGILNAASYAVGTPVAPGSIVAVYGSFPLSAPAMTPGAPWPTSLGGLSMQFAGGTKAPLYYVSSGQVNLLVPWELANQSQAPLTATMNGLTSTAQTVSLAAFSPGIFSMNGQGTGQGAILDTSYKLVDQSNPALAGTTYLQIYCTGLGPVSNQPASGAVSPTNPLASTPTTPAVTIGGVPAQVIFSGLAPGFVGEYQVNALVPASAAPGNAVPVTISIGGRTSNTVTIAVRAATGGPPATLVSVNPSSGSAGRVFTAVLTGLNTGFLQGQAYANFGAGISVAGAQEGQPGMLTVVSPTSATATVMIDPAASTGLRTVTVTTGAQVASGNSMFTVFAAPPAMGPLTITSTSPTNGASGVSLSAAIQIQFNGSLDPASVGSSTFGLAAGKTPLPVSVVYDPAKNLVSLAPAGVLSPQRTYTVTVGALVRNAAGNPLGTDSTFSFATIPPVSVSGTVVAPTGISAANLTVVSFGGQTSTPATNGSFTASVNPAGVGLVAAMVPGKDFGLLSITVGGAAATVPLSSQVAPALEAPELAAALASPRVYRTRWQITASSLAAVSPNGLVQDVQTLAESLIFLTPSLFTKDKQRAPAILSVIAANPATVQLATALAQSASKADPLSDPSVVAAAQSAVQAVVRALAQQKPSNTMAHLEGGAEAALVDSSTPTDSAVAGLPATVSVTPYCYPSFSTPATGLPCLDLRYLSFQADDAVTVSQSGGGYGFSPQNCTGMIGGCAMGWLARIKPTLSNPATILPEGGTESPVGAGNYDSLTCDSSTKCYSAWVTGKSWFEFLDLPGLLVTGLSAGLAKLGVPIDGTNFSLPENTSQKEADYIARFYSGATADATENQYIANNAYTDGRKLSVQANVMNVIETAFNLVSAVPGMDSATPILDCVLQDASQELLQGSLVIANSNTISGFLDTCKDVAVNVAKDAASCALQQGAQTAVKSSLFKMVLKVLTAATGVGAIVEAVLQGLDSVSNFGQAAQRFWEMTSRASAVETAVITIKPGPALVMNPVPSITLLSPLFAQLGGNSQTVTISGVNFLKSSVVAVNNQKRTASFSQSGQLILVLSSSDLGTAGSLELSVTNPAPGGGTSKADFLVNGSVIQSPQPQITSLFPSSATAGTTSQALTVRGKNFQSSSTVKFNGVSHAISTPSDAGQVTITLGASDLAKPGTVPVVVVNPGVNNSSTAFNFTILDANSTQPAVTSIWTSQRTYVTGDPFAMTYTSVAGTIAGTYDLMVSIVSVASGNTYYYYDDPTDYNSRWLHSTVRPAWVGTPQTGQSTIPAGGGSIFQVTDDIPSGDYHIKVYFSKSGTNQVLNVIAETDFSLQTSTAAGGCFIATAAFGSAMARQVQCLRVFRDRTLLSAWAGRAFVRWYYQWSPRAAGWLRVHSMARKLTRAVLWVPVAFAWTSLRTNVVLASMGFVALLLVLGWSLRRGPAWWKVLCLLILALGMASAQAAPLETVATPAATSSSFRPPPAPTHVSKSALHIVQNWASLLRKKTI